MTGWTLNGLFYKWKVALQYGISSKLYADRDLKKTTWMELVEIFLHNPDAQSSGKSGSDASRKTQYVYFKQLSFLGPIVKGETTTSSIDKDNSAMEEEVDDHQYTTSSLVARLVARDLWLVLLLAIGTRPVVRFGGPVCRGPKGLYRLYEKWSNLYGRPSTIASCAYNI